MARNLELKGSFAASSPYDTADGTLACLHEIVGSSDLGTDNRPLTVCSDTAKGRLCSGNPVLYDPGVNCWVHVPSTYGLGDVATELIGLTV